MISVMNQAYKTLDNNTPSGTTEINTTLHLDDGSTVEGDAFVIGLGVSPRVSLAEQTGLKTDDGVSVDEYLRTKDPSIWAAGNSAFYPDKILGKTRIKHVPDLAAVRAILSDPPTNPQSLKRMIRSK